MGSTAAMNISESVKVESPEHLSQVLTRASEAGTPVMPIGGGTCIDTGQAVDGEFVAVDLSGMSGIVDYIPTDMTAGFLAGTPMRVVRETLAANGQELPVDLTEDDAGTIGGLVSTGFSGPRRYGQGTLKDLLIGSEYVRGDGLIAKAGGMTVKNVSGFEISRMLHGSWGALAVLTRVNLKIIPKPRADRSLYWRDADADSALARQERLLARFPNAIAIQSARSEDGWDTAIRFSGRELAVDDYMKQAISGEGEASVVSSASSYWAPVPSTCENAQLVLSTASAHLQKITNELLVTGAVTNLSVSFSIGTIRAEVNQDMLTKSDLTRLGAQLWMIEGGNESWKADLPVWGPTRADQVVMQSIKQQFDPANILNRGRLFI